ncbi:MAG TPA: HAMP domain-containing sensor histidine kinase, partial [Myxococcota bacterium]|nr:HAMP domain-containing sensor histidine kinase [Myxococcota bacterium]
TRASFADLGPLAKWRSSTAMMAAVARHRALAAQAALIRGDPAAARKTVRDLATDTSTLSAPVLERVLPVVQQAVRVLTTANQDARDLRDLLTPAETRVDAWRALQHHPSHEPSKIASEGPRFLSHLHSDLPWAAYIVPPDAGGRGIALLLLPSRLHEDFLRVDAGRFNGAVAIVDPIGRPVAGARNAELAAETEVPFSLALRHEQVAFTRRTADGRIDPLLDTWWSWRNLVTLLSIVLGFGALAMLTNADRQRRELARRQREFTTRVTHELKTPLAGIKVMAENLAAGAFRDEDQREHMAQRIVSEADRLTARVNEILNLGREQVQVAHEPFDVEEIVLDAIDEWGPRYEEAGVQLLADVDPIDPVTGDARAIRDAIACLLDNALKYRREDVESQVWLDVRGEDDAVEILVTDNGIGVPAAERQRIFERFVRVEGPNRGKAGGHGLGLAQVAAIVQAHRGTVTCEDGVDGGARFRVRLPVAPAAR